MTTALSSHIGCGRAFLPSLTCTCVDCRWGFSFIARSDKVVMGASGTVHGLGDRLDCCMKPFRNRRFFTRQRIKHRQYNAGLAFVFARQIQLETPVNATKQDFCLQRRSLAVACLSRGMPGNQQLVGPFLAQHLDSHQHWRHDDRMKTVYSDCLYWMKALDWLPIFSCKGDVPPQVSDCSTVLQPTYHVAFRQVLVF